MSKHEQEGENTEFQIAPMVDVIFLLILFFMCSAGSSIVENEMGIKLPGRVEQGSPSVMIDEQIVQIDEAGQVILNDQKFDGPADKEMPTLTQTLRRFKAISDDNKTPCLVTIWSHPNTKYERVIDVLNACAAAKISSVTFSTYEGG